jgi:hypothetical protein
MEIEGDEVQENNGIERTQIIIGLEEIKNFKDVEVTFPKAKGKEIKSLVSTYDEIEEWVSKEHFPRCSRRKDARVIREE